MSWNSFIENFQGKRLDAPISCENGVGVCKNEKYAIRVYRCIWKNGWINASGESIVEPFEVLCTPSFGSDVECGKWLESSINEDESVVYSYYVKLESCESFVEKPGFPEIV